MEAKYSNTGIKIKDAAKCLFLKKGYSATTTREIAKESSINLALLNYYFTSKRKLFEIIMLETIRDFMSKMVEIYNDEKTTLEEKLKLTSSKYIDMIIAEPHLPMFVVNELKNNPSSVLKIIRGKMIMESKLVDQYNDGVKKGLYKKGDPIHMRYSSNTNQTLSIIYIYRSVFAFYLAFVSYLPSALSIKWSFFKQ